MPFTLGMSVNKKTFVIAGLPVSVYSDRSRTDKSGPVAVMFFLHGRTGTAKSIEWIAEDTVKQVAQKRKKHDGNALDLFVVTFVSHTFASCLGMRLICVTGSAQPWSENDGPTRKRCVEEREQSKSRVCPLLSSNIPISDAHAFWSLRIDMYAIQSQYSQ